MQIYKPYFQSIFSENLIRCFSFAAKDWVVFFEGSDNTALLVGSPFPSNKVGKDIDAKN